MIFKYLKFVLLFVLFVAKVSLAAMTSVVVEGYGVDYGNAVLNGLKQAVAQVSGISISVSSLSHLLEKTSNAYKNNTKSNYTTFDQETQHDIASKVNGYIAGYQILNVKKEDNIHKVNMQVDIEKYASPGTLNNRYSLSIVDMKAETGRCFGNSLSADKIKQEVKNALLSVFTATRKFIVLDREEQAAYDMEEKIISGWMGSNQETIKLHNVKGADYILTANVKNLNITGEQQHIILTNEDVIVRQASAEIQYKIFVFATRQVKVSSSVKVSLSSQEIHSGDCGSILALLMKKGAEKIAKECINNIYPIRIISITGKDIYINMGGQSVKKGSVFGIYNAERELIDPYTGESLGAEEKYVGSLKIKTVNPKYSVGTLIKGKLDDIDVDQVCRQE